MDANARIKVKNMIKGTVVINDPNTHFRREWNNKGQVMTIPFEILQDLVYQDGVQSMLNEGILLIDDKQARIDLGLEDPDIEPVKTFLTENQMRAALIGTPEDIAAAIDKLPPAQVEEFVNLAVEGEYTDMAKVDIIKKKTGKDVLQLVKFNRQLKEAPVEDKED